MTLPLPAGGCTAGRVIVTALIAVIAFALPPGELMARTVRPHIGNPNNLTYGGGLNRTLQQVRAVTIPMPVGINVHYGPLPQQYDPAAAGYANGTDIYLRGKDPWSRAHEYGHQLDRAALTAQDRQRLEQLLGGQGAWSSGDGTVAGSYKSPAEWFADYYAAAATGYNPRKQFHEGYTTVTPRRLRQFKKALAQIAAAHPELVQYQP